MADFKIGRIRFTWQGNWATGAEYTKDDIVRYGGKSYVCLVGHTASADFYDDLYYINTATEPDTAAPKWTLWFDGYEWTGDWTQGQFYKVGDIAKYGSIVYLCNETHTATPNTRSLTVKNAYGTGTNVLDTENVSGNGAIITVTYAAQTKVPFYVGQVVTLSGVVPSGYNATYTVETASTTQVTFLGTQTGAMTTAGTITSTDGMVTLEYDAVTSAPFAAGDVVTVTGVRSTTYNGTHTIKECTASKITYLGTVSAQFYPPFPYIDLGGGNQIRITNVVGDGSQVTVTFEEQTVAPFTVGQVATIVGVQPPVYNGARTVAACTTSTFVYIGATTEVFVAPLPNATYGSVTGPQLAVLEQDQEKWTAYAKTDNWLTDWTVDTRYKLNDVVKYNGILYRCTANHTSADNITDGLEADQGKWQLISFSELWRTDWTPGTRYRRNDVVRYGGIVYRCVAGHTSAATASLGLEYDQSSWQIVHSGIDIKGTWQTDTKYKLNDLVKWGANQWICNLGHISDSADFDTPYWDLWMPGLEYMNAWDQFTAYVPGDVVKYGGYSYFALTFNENIIPSTNPSDWELLTKGFKILGEWSPATFYETGDVIRRFGKLFVAIADSQAVEPEDITKWELVVDGIHWKDKWVANQTYLPGDVVNYISTSYRCVQQHLSSAGTNPENDSAHEYWIVYVQGEKTNRLLLQGDILTHNGSNTVRYGIGTTQGDVLQVINNAPAWSTFTDVAGVYYVALNGVDDPTYGTNLNAPWRTLAYAVTQVQGPATIFIKTGVYYEVLPIVIPANVAIVGDELRSTVIKPQEGFETSDMFYVRNGTGIRNMTLMGLSGTLGSYNQYGTQRPTAGAFVSLDPGSGPNDSNAWITNKSPYVQNVTTFGTGCVGLKIDGAIHNGGNKSIVANDFTQVLSDGIGCWCTNLGLTELVSVFSYYGHIGYLAENGGKIRATNGNSSYGTYGCVSEGVSALEVPITGTINNRFYEAQIKNVFIGEASDQVLKLEFSNAGNAYTNATYSFSGSGTNANAVGDEFRDGAIFEVRILQSSINSGYGGTGYEIVSNNCQAGDPYTVTIASNDKNPATSLLNKRVLITSGTGVGQYGQVAGLDYVSKILYVAKESVTTLTASATNSTNNLITVNDTTYFPASTRVYFNYLTYTITITSAYGPSDLLPPGATKPNQLLVSDTTNLVVGMPITFSSAYGTIVQTNTYYVSEIVDATHIKISATNGGPTFTLSAQSGTVIGTVGGLMGGGALSTNTPYYVLSANRTSTQFAVSLSDGGAAVTLPVNVGRMYVYAAGWDHINPGTPAINLLDTTSVYSIEPKATFSAPTYSSTASVLPASANWTGVAYGNNRFVIISDATNAAYSADAGATWTTSTLPSSSTWAGITYGSGSFVAVGNSTMAMSADGASWSTIPGVPTYTWLSVATDGTKFVSCGTDVVATSNNGVSWGASTVLGTWKSVAYGKNTWVMVGTNAVSYSTNDGGSWTTSAKTGNWVSVTYGNGRFVAIVTGGTGAMYSLDGITWYDSALPASRTWTQIAYGQGVFYAVASGGNGTASSQDGLTWVARSTAAAASWKAVAFGNPTVSSNKVPRFLAVSTSGSTAGRVISCGATAIGRPVIDGNSVTIIKLWEPGSGYTGTPTCTVYDAVNTSNVLTLCRVGDGALGNPTFTNRGSGYRSSSTVCTVTGDGYADIYQVGKFVIVSGLSRTPGPGANLIINGIPDVIYKIVKITELSGGNMKFQIAPYLKIFNSPAHGTSLIIREKYSQVRLTGHDFLLIGTGNFESTNYPNTDVNELAQQNEIVESGGGRCFYTSTDQDGNFRVGELFKVEQATGTVTISADLFELTGLEELSLGGVAIGGSNVVVREFSTDPFFTADSNNVVPTQKAIKAYVAKRISGGGSDAQTGVLVAGIVRVGPQKIDTTTNTQVYMKNKVKITKGIDGSMLAMSYFADSFNNNDGNGNR